jgi:hypothetical protein
MSSNANFVGDDLFRIIERNDFKALENMIQNESARLKLDCQREDRHYSAFTYAAEC